MLILPRTLKQGVFGKRIGHRAAGVVYRPQNDFRQYVPSVLRNRWVLGWMCPSLPSYGTVGRTSCLV